MGFAAIHSWTLFGFFCPISWSPQIAPPKRPGPTLARTILVNATSRTGHKKNAGVIVATDLAVGERHLLTPITPHRARVGTSEISITELVVLGQSGDFCVGDPRETGRTGTAIATAGARKTEPSRIPRHSASRLS